MKAIKLHNILLVEPKFPTKTKSRNHKNFLPIGLLKLSSYYKSFKNYDVELVRGKALPTKFEIPSIIEITSLFTYWSEYVWDTIKFYRDNFPDPNQTKIRLGGIYASLHFQNDHFREKCKKYDVLPVSGIQKKVENFFPDYGCILETENPIDYQVVHLSRGCFRNCSFCGTWIIEPEYEYKSEITSLIYPGLEFGLRNLVFYDNNFLFNPNIESILNEMVDLKKQKKIGWCESQSGFDGRILAKNPKLAFLLKKSGFRNPRIAWDWGIDGADKIKKQIKILESAGYNRKSITIFMIYNWTFNFDEMEKKRIKCWEWNVQISDCRYRPLNQLHDHYKPKKDQSYGEDYHINPNWTDAEVKQFRKNVRRQNICIRQNLNFHSRLLENKKYTREECGVLKSLNIEKARLFLPDIWSPKLITRPKNKNRWESIPVKRPDISMIV
jgi:hypothetical protein